MNRYVSLLGRQCLGISILLRSFVRTPPHFALANVPVEVCGATMTLVDLWLPNLDLAPAAARRRYAQTLSLACGPLAVDLWCCSRQTARLGALRP